MDPFAVKPVVGAQLDPGDVVGRDTLILRALELLDSGNNLIINDPRRIGKTCVLDRLVNSPGTAFEAAVKIDYEGVSTTHDFLMRTVKVLQRHAPAWKRVQGSVARFFDNAELKAAGKGAELTIKPAQSDRRPEELLQAVVDTIDADLRADDLSMIIAMDEVPLAVHNIVRQEESGPADAALLLQHLRNARKQSTNIGWIVTGSVGFHHILKMVKDGTEGMINDLLNFPLGPLQADDTWMLARCLALGIDRPLESEAQAAIHYHTDGIPYLVQALFHRIDESYPQQPITAELIADAAAAYFDDRDSSRANDHFLNRIDIYFPASLRGAATAMLDLIAENESATAAELIEVGSCHGLDRDDFRSVRNLLVDDHYLIETGGTLSWRYPVLGRLWKQRRLG